MLKSVNNIHLDARLTAAADLVPQGSVAADIGCDHGKLAGALALKCRKVIAIDSAPKPLAQASALMQSISADNVECRLGNGLQALAEGEAEFIIIAGLSAQTICDILFASSFAKNEHYTFILIPTTKHYILRKRLYQEGFSFDEGLAKAAGRVYTIMSARYCAKPVSMPDALCARGMVHGENAAEYLSIEAGKLLKRALGEDEDTARATKAIAEYLQTEATLCRQSGK